MLLKAEHFSVQEAYYLELTDATRARVIKRAHQLSCSLIEFHSHVGHAKAQFSGSDIAGFKDIVPHIWWRLAKRPYAAVVVARDGFDAFIWSDNPEAPVRLDQMKAGERILYPTNRTIWNFNEQFE
jgi:hypothetical protein